MAYNCEITVEKQGSILIVGLHGRIDTRNAEDLHLEVNNEVEQENGPLVLDFAGVSFLASAGLRVALRIAKSLDRQGRPFAIASLNDSVRDVVAISGLDQLVPVYDSRDVAVRTMQSG